MVGPEGLRLSLEELDEHAADDGPFLLRVHDASQRPEEFVCGVDDPMPHPELFQGLRDVFRLSFPHEPGVDIDREKAVSEGATREDRCRRAVDATGTPGGICETLRTASRFSLPLTGTPITGFVVWAAIVPGSAAERPAIAMKTFAVVFRIKSRRRSGVRWADATTMSYPTPNWSRNELACFPTSASVLEPRTMRTSTGIGWDKVGSWNKGFPLPRRSAETDLALHDCQEEEPNRRGGSDDRREDHADRLGDRADQVGACIVRACVPRPENPDDQTPHEKSDPNLAALPASEVRREGARDHEEECEGQKQDCHECQRIKRFERH